MKYRQLGKTGINVSAICQGCWSIIPEDFTWGGNPEAESLAAIDAALDAGINFFDTAPGYGNGESERLLGKALGARRKDLVIATKVPPDKLAPADLAAACEQSLRLLGTDYVDLYQIHWPNPNIPLGDTWSAMCELVRQGKVRAAGVSNFGTSYLRELSGQAAGGPACASNQLCYSLLFRAIEHELLPTCRQMGMGVLCYSPIAQGLLTGKFRSADDVPATRARNRLFRGDRPHSRHGESGCEQEVFAALDEIRGICERIGRPMEQVALAWLLAQPGVTSVVAGGRTADQTRSNAAAADLELPADVLAALTKATDSVKAKLGANTDAWQHVSRLERP